MLTLKSWLVFGMGLAIGYGTMMVILDLLTK